MNTSKWKAISVSALIEVVIVGFAIYMFNVSLWLFALLLVVAILFPLSMVDEKFRGLTDSCTAMTDVLFLIVASTSFNSTPLPLWFTIPLFLFFIIDIVTFKNRRKAKLQKPLFPRLSDGLICVQFYILFMALLVILEANVVIFASTSAVFALFLLFFFFHLAKNLSAFARRELRIVWIIDVFSVIYSIQALLDANSYASIEILMSALTLFYCIIDLVRWKSDM